MNPRGPNEDRQVRRTAAGFNQTLERMTTREGIIGEANVIGAGSHTLSFSLGHFAYGAMDRTV